MGEAVKYLLKKVEEMHKFDDAEIEKSEKIKKTKPKTKIKFNQI